MTPICYTIRANPVQKAYATDWLNCRGRGASPHDESQSPFRRSSVVTLLWLIAVALVIAGIVCLLTGRIILGAVLIVVGLLVGPGGVSIWDFDDGDDDLGTVATIDLPPPG